MLADAGAMSFDVCGVYRAANYVALPCQRIENAAPHTLAAPAIEAIVDRGVRPINSPSRARSKHVDDAADNAAIVHTVGSAASSWQVGLNC